MTELVHSKREHSSPERNELFAALAKAQAEFQAARKESANPFFKSKYAGLDQIVDCSRPALTKHGLSVTQQILPSGTGSVLVSILGHSSGQWISSEMGINPIKNDVQSLGGYITYLRRYCYAALVGVVVSDEDDDGETAMNRRAAPTVPAKLGKINQETINKLSETFGEDETIFKRFNLRSWADLNQSDLPEAIKILNT